MANRFGGNSTLFVAWNHLTLSIKHLLCAFGLYPEPANSHFSFLGHLKAAAVSLWEAVSSPFTYLVFGRFREGQVFLLQPGERAYIKAQAAFAFRAFGRNMPRVSTPVMRGI